MNEIFKSKRFWAAIASVAAIALKDRLPITEDQLTNIIMVIGAWIVGDSLRSTVGVSAPAAGKMRSMLSFSSPTAATAMVGESAASLAGRDTNLRLAIRRAIRAADINQAIRDAGLNMRQRIAARVAVWFAPWKLEDEIFRQAQAEGVLPTSLTLDGDVAESAVMAIDWQAFGEFLKVILPIVFQFIFALMDKNEPDA